MMLDFIAAETGIDRALLATLDEKLRVEVGGDRHYIASNAARRCQQRRADIIKAIDAGTPVASVAERFGISRQRA